MSIPKLKTLIIAVLLLLNLFFLTDIVWRRVEYALEINDATNSLTEILANSGIALDGDAISKTEAPAVYKTSTDAYAEAAIARAVLGECDPETPEAGQSQRFRGELGTAVFYTRGDFIIEITGDLTVSGSSRSAVKKLLRNMGIVTDNPAVTVLGDTDVVTALCTWRGNTVFNCTVTFELSGGRLLRVMGRRPSVVADSAQPAPGKLAAAVLAFLRFNLTNEAGCTVIHSVQPGYRMNIGSYGDGEITPGWLFVTDIGDFFADAVNGDIIRNDI